MRARAVGLVLAAAALVGSSWAPLRAQADTTGTARSVIAASDSARADSVAAYGPETPPAPYQFRLGLSASRIAWGGSTTRSPENAWTWGLDVERILLPYVSLRFGASYLPERVVQGADATDVHGYLVEVAAEPRLALPSLRRVGVIPFATIGIGSMIFDPATDALPTRSQNTFLVGGGIEVRLGPRWGGRLEWRHEHVDLQSLFDATALGSVSDHADRVGATLYWTF